MTNTLLVTRPRHDEATNYLYYFAQVVIEEAKKRNFKVIDLKGDKANFIDFSGRMVKVNPDVVFFNGHGSPDAITGHDREVLVDIGKKETILIDKIIYALSCSSAKNLGKYLVENGTKSFIGYSEDFMFLYEKDKSTRPLEDKTAGLFLEPSNLVMTTLIKGNTSQEAFERSKKEFKRNLRKIMASESPQDDKSPARLLYWDMIHLTHLGDGEAKLS